MQLRLVVWALALSGTLLWPSDPMQFATFLAFVMALGAGVAVGRRIGIVRLAYFSHAFGRFQHSTRYRDSLSRSTASSQLVLLSHPRC